MTPSSVRNVRTLIFLIKRTPFKCWVILEALHPSAMRSDPRVPRTNQCQHWPDVAGFSPRNFPSRVGNARLSQTSLLLGGISSSPPSRLTQMLLLSIAPHTWHMHVFGETLANLEGSDTLCTSLLMRGGQGCQQCRSYCLV